VGRYKYRLDRTGAEKPIFAGTTVYLETTIKRCSR
jgi:hypothetical protein